MLIFKDYRPLGKEVWTGRIDDPEDFDAFRWHQVISPIDLGRPDPGPAAQGNPGFGFLGFRCDTGVLRNLGRTGTSKAPLSIRQEMANLPCRFEAATRLFDAGDICCEDGDLESAQQDLRVAVTKLLSEGLFPIVLGGGHEIALGHYNGIADWMSQRCSAAEPSIGIVSFDAHFDLRPYDRGGNSGTMFLQIADQCKAKGAGFSYFCLGIQRYANTVRLFKTAKELNAQYVLAKDMADFPVSDVHEKLDRFIRRHDRIYLTICADVFSSAFAPGVSSPQPFGLHPEIVLSLMKHILKSGKVASFDLAEVSPRFDEDNITSKLAAVVVFALVTTLVETRE